MVFLSSSGNWDLDELWASHGTLQGERGLLEVIHLFFGTVPFPKAKNLWKQQDFLFFVIFQATHFSQPNC